MFDFVWFSVLEGQFGLEKFGNLVENVDNVVLLSLYSGLGGAELSLKMVHEWTTHHLDGLQKEGKLRDLQSPSKPFCLLSCDVDTACQKVLEQHAEPPAHICADILDFIKPEVVARMEKLADKARSEQAAYRKEDEMAKKAAKLAKKAQEKRGKNKAGAKPKPKGKTKPQTRKEDDEDMLWDDPRLSFDLVQWRFYVREHFDFCQTSVALLLTLTSDKLKV